MSAADVPLVIDQGEDWTANIIWTDTQDEPMYVIHPCRLEIQSLGGATVAQLETDPELPEGQIPSIAVSSEIGMLQFHMPKEQTVALTAGEYRYDLFVTCDDGNEYSGTQVVRLIAGSATVFKSYTRM